MDGIPPRLELVLRRWKMDFKYSSISSPRWTPFEDSEYSSEQRESICSRRPENRRFEIIDDRGGAAGSIVVHTCRPNKFYRGTTPWGEFEIRKVGLTKYEILRGPILIGVMKERLSGRTAIISFQLDQELRFRGWRLWYSKMKAQTENGTVSVVCEHGRRPNPGPNKHKVLSRRDYRSLTEQEKAAVVETDQYIQWRISLSGSMPTRDDDILGVLAMCICRGCLYLEYVSATSGYPV